VNSDAVAQLQRRYADHCDGDWEHQQGVEIGTLDNPGWSVKIALGGTGLEERSFDRIHVDRAEDDWLRAWVEADKWNAACGPLNLVEAVEAFLAWASP
jgi:hypothetical protein